jgi:hypothetical protein
MALQVRRGTNAERLGITPLAGELIYVTDTKQLYIGDGTTAGGTTSIANTIDSVVADTSPQLGGELDLNGNNITGTGNINITGTISASGNINLGDGVGSDILVIGGAIQGHLVPDTDITWNLGSTSKHFNEAWISQLNVENQLTVGRIMGDLIADDSTVVFDASTGLVAAAQLTGTLPAGVIPAAMTSNITGSLTGNADGAHTGTLVGDVEGSVFGDDSTLLVDGVNNTITGIVTGALDTTGFAINSIYADTTRTDVLQFKKYAGTKAAPEEPANFARAGLGFSSWDSSTSDYINEAVIFSYHQTAGGGYLGLSPVSTDYTTFFDTALELDGNAQKMTVAAKKGSTFDGPISPAVYADNTARDTAIATPTAGMMVFNTTGTKFQGYTGSAWVDLN